MYFFHNGIYIPVELHNNFPGDIFLFLNLWYEGKRFKYFSQN